MVFFLGFLVLITIIVPMITLSQVGQLGLSLVFALTLILGALTIIRHRIVIYLVIGLTVSTFAVSVINVISPSQSPAVVETSLRLACLSILLCLTLERTLRPGPVTVYRVVGGIAGYMLIGLVWTFAYQLLVEQAPGAFHFEPDVADTLSQEPNHLIYFSFVTLTTVGYGDVHPVHPIARSLAVAEALVGQLYIAILISSLVGMALQARSASVRGSRVRAGPTPTKSSI